MININQVKGIVVPDIEDAFQFLVRFLREGDKTIYSNYGYDLYLPNVMRIFLRTTTGMEYNDAERYLSPISPPFYSAAWDLCRRGILRPGVKALHEQATTDGSAGNGYSITSFGKEWLSESDRDDYVPTEPGRFAEMLTSTGSRFGGGFQERAQEAIRCYVAHAYLACCAMCGAAAEAIILQIAIAKKGDEEAIIKEYLTSGGRGKIERIILSQKPERLKNAFATPFDLLKYWRDNASHGQSSGITDNEAFTALVILLRLTQLASDNWNELIN